MERSGADDRDDLSLLERCDRILAALERRSDAEPHSTTVKVDNRVDNRRSERAAWISGVAAAIAVTASILMAFQIQSQQAQIQTLEGRTDRMQDYLNFIYQQAPHLRKPEQSK
jgi:ferric-dicitrate binding protein FerR (iron transport regulator)